MTTPVEISATKLHRNPPETRWVAECPHPDGTIRCYGKEEADAVELVRQELARREGDFS